MQRVLFEILRRSRDSNDRATKKRKVDTMLREDGKYAEELYDRETRGERPGLISWTALKHRRTGEYDTANTRMMHMAVYQ